MKKEEVKNFLDNTKVYVNRKSREIQEKLFSLGYKWLITEGKVLHEDKPFLFIHERGEITYTEDMMWFANHEYREITAEEIISLEVTESYRPFKNQGECWNEMMKHQPFGWIKSKYAYIAVTAVIKDEIELGVNMEDDGNLEILTVPYQKAFDEYEFADGTPFGIMEE